MTNAEYISIGLAVVALLVTWYYGHKAFAQARMSVTKKAIAIGSVSKIIYEKSPNLNEDFQTFFRGDAINRITDNHVFLMNVGNTDIALEDFITPASLELPQTEHIYDCRIIDKRPHDLNAEIKYENERIIFSPVHLNAGDYIAVKYLRAGKPTFGMPSGRVKGVSEIDYLLPGAYDSWYIFLPSFYVALGLTAIALAAWSFWGAKYNGQIAAALPLIIGIVLITTAAYHWRTFRVLRTAKYMGRGTEHLEFTPLVREDR